MENIKSQELKLMKFGHGPKDKLLNSKICEQERKGLEETNTLVRRYVATQTLQSGLEKKKADKGHVVNSLMGLRGRSPASSPDQRRKSERDSRGRSGDRRRDNFQGRRREGGPRFISKCVGVQLKVRRGSIESASRFI